MKRALIVVLALTSPVAASAQTGPRFEVTIAPAASAAPLTGRLVLLITKTSQPEPRLQLSLRGPMIAGLDLEEVKPDQPVVVDDAAVAYPSKLSTLPAGDYF